MKIFVLMGGLLIGSGSLLVQAGTVFELGNSSGTEGTLTLNSDAIHVEGPSASDINLPDVLEADFGETPFQLSYFSSAESPNRLPADLKGADLGKPTLTGSATYADGTLTLTGAGSELQKGENNDEYYIFGQPWTGNAQLTVRVKEIDGDRTQFGPMLRENVDASSIFTAMGLAGMGGGLYLSRGTTGNHAGWVNFSSDMPPIWLRMIRSGDSLDVETSGDGRNWEINSQGGMQMPTSAWLGFFLNSYSQKTMGKAIVDQITFAPGVAESEMLPPGVLLRSGSFLAGSFHTSDAKGGTVDRNGKPVALTTAQIAAVILHPVTQRQIADVASQAGLIMKNGDFLAADIQSINGGYITVNSLLLGIASYEASSGRACVLHTLQEQPSDYEVRLKDGSIVRATSFNAGGGQIAIEEVSGASVDASADEIAQVRAGLTKVQPLIELPWKATSLLAPQAPAPTPSPSPAATTNAPSTNAAAPAANAVVPADTTPDVQSWEGPNQEQILAVPSGTALEFPLNGKFSALALRIGIAPGVPPNAQVSVRILADGREIGRTPPFKAGGQPAFVELSLLSPRKVTFVAEANFAEVKTLLIDPVAIRQTSP